MEFTNIPPEILTQLFSLLLLVIVSLCVIGVFVDYNNMSASESLNKINNHIHQSDQVGDIKKRKKKKMSGSSPIEGGKAIVHPQPCLSRRLIGANWQNFGFTFSKPKVAPIAKVPRSVAGHHLPTTKSGVKITKHIAIDCEMVGIGFQGRNHMLARVSVVNQMGEVLLDKFVKPREDVVDYRTNVSGIRPRDIKDGEDFLTVQKEVADLLLNRILVGHAVYNDLKVLFLSHPARFLRDTSKYRPLAKMVTGGATPSLKVLARILLGNEIQEGEHSSVEDARAAMQIYNKCSQDWEKLLKRRNN